MTRSSSIIVANMGEFDGDFNTIVSVEIKFATRQVDSDCWEPAQGSG